MTFLLLCGLTSAQQKFSTGNIVLNHAKAFLGTPYVAHTLEVNQNEQLVVNTKQVDCTTLVENVVAQSLNVLQGKQEDKNAFARNLQDIRYRNGVVDGYTSRLHYIAEWITNGVKMGFFKDVTAKYSPWKKKLSLSFMTTHVKSYSQLAESPDNVSKMKAIEKKISGQTIHWLPKDKLPEQGLPYIKDGDIITIMTNIKGLDVAHLGFAIYVNDTLHLLHASSTEKKVVVSQLPLNLFLKSHKSWTGIRVLRVN